MIYGKLWLVVRPTVGIPVFLGAVAVGSFAVHLALLTNTTWVPKFLEGKGAKTASVEVQDRTALAPPPGVVIAEAPTAKQ